eukprot:6731442-Pyramimonas_sp.AAC.1
MSGKEGDVLGNLGRDEGDALEDELDGKVDEERDGAGGLRERRTRQADATGAHDGAVAPS